MTANAPISASRTPLGAVVLRVDPIRDEVLDALGRAALRDPDELLSLLTQLGQAQADLDDDHSPRSVRPVDLAAIRDDLLTLADYGHPTTILTEPTAMELHWQLHSALETQPAERTAA